MKSNSDYFKSFFLCVCYSRNVVYFGDRVNVSFKKIGNRNRSAPVRSLLTKTVEQGGMCIDPVTQRTGHRGLVSLLTM